jgi:hypothetical protein
LFVAFTFVIQNFGYAQTLSQDQLIEAAQSKSVYLGLQSRGGNFFETQAAFNAYWDGKEPTKGQGYKTFKRYEHFFEERTYPSGALFPSNARQVAERVYTFSPADNSTNSDPLLYSWQSFGPDSAMGGCPSVVGNGRVNKVRVDPNDATRLFAATPGGGIWRKEADKPWTQLCSDTLAPFGGTIPNIGMSDIAIDPNDSNILYAASGDHDGFDNYSVGVYKSVDGGASWSLSYDANDGDFGTDEVWQEGNGYSSVQNGKMNFTISRILISPDVSTKIVASTRQGILYTADAGASWQMATQIGGDPLTTMFHDLEFKPGDANIMYAGGEGEFWRSVDAGLTWSETTITNDPGIKRTAIAVAPSEPNTVYLIAAGADRGLFGENLFKSQKGIYKSIDSGATWSVVASTDPEGHPNLLTSKLYGNGSGGQGNYDLCIAVAPNNADSIFVGGVNLWNSPDGGGTWNQIANWQTVWDDPTLAHVHADHHGLTFNNNTLVVANDGGVFTTDDGETFTNITTGLVNGQIYSMGLAQDTLGIASWGLQDNATQLQIDNRITTFPGGGDGFETEVWGRSSHNDNVNNGVNSDDTFLAYHSTQNGRFQRATNGWGWCDDNDIARTEIAAPDGTAGTVNEKGEWQTPLLVAPNDPAHILIGKTKIYESIDYGQTFNTLPCEGLIEDNSGYDKCLNHLERSWVDQDVFYATDKNQIFRSMDGGATFDDVTDNLPNKWISDIEVDDANPQRVFISMSNYGAGEKVFVSVDAGNNWEDMSDGIPDVPVNCIYYREGYTDEIYIGTDIGVYKWNADAIPSVWEDFNLDMPNVIVMDIRIHNSTNEIYAATYGRSMWKAQLPVTHTEEEDLLFCDASSISIDLDTIHDGGSVGDWDYWLNETIDASMGTGTIDGSILTIDGSATSTGIDTIKINGFDENNNTAILHIEVEEALYPRIVDSYTVLPPAGTIDGGGVQFTFAGDYDSPVLMNFLHHEPASTNEFGGVLLRSDSYWALDFTNIKGCSNPAPANTTTPGSDSRMLLSVPHIIPD